MYSRFLLLGFVAVHLIYALFITVPRYASTAMPCVIAFAAAGLIALASLIRSPQTRRLGGALVIAGLLLWVGLYNNFVQLLMDTGLFSSVIFALGIQIGVKFILVAILFLLLWTTYTETSGYRRLSRIVLIGTMMILVPLLLLPGRAAGRWFEWEKAIADKPIVQTIDLPKDLGDQQTYLMVDANGANSLVAADVTVNGKKLTGPVIPGMAMAQDYSTLRHSDNGKVSWEGESIFNFMTRPADLSNLDLRQWFLIPIPEQITSASGKAIRVAIKNHGGTDGVIYGSYNHGKQVSLPSVATYSWEKAFYGVENPGGLSDPRLDDSISLPSKSINSKSVIPNIRLLVPASAGDGVALLKRAAVKNLVLTPQHAVQPFQIYTMPPFAKNDLWVIRTTGEIKSNSGATCPSISLVAVCAKANCQYESPWTPNSIPTGNGWHHFEISSPIAPGQLPGGIKQLHERFVFDVPKWKTSHEPPDDSVQFRNVSVDIIRIPGNPLARGFSIY